MRGLFSHVLMVKFGVRKKEIMKELVEYIKYVEDLKKNIEDQHAGSNEIHFNQQAKEKYSQQLKRMNNQNPWNITWDEILEDSPKEIKSLNKKA